MCIRDEGKGRNRPGDDQRGFLARGNRTKNVVNSHGVGRIDGAGVEGLLRSESHPYAAQSHYETHVSAR